MAAESRPRHPALTEPAAPALRETLAREPYTFRFFQAVRLLIRLSAGRSPVGRFVPPSREVVRFAAHQSMGFPASEIQALEFPSEGPARMLVNFFGLTGPSGVLPLVYTEFMRQRLRAGDRAAAEFLDVFNHRMLSLFYAAWEKYRFYVGYERGERDTVSPHLREFIGMGTDGLENRLAVPDDALLFFSGLLAPHARSATGLRQMLEDYFGVPVEVKQFVGAWFRLSPDTQCEVGGEDSPSQMLGAGAVVGDEVWDQQACVRIVLGPLSLRQYLSFLPTGAAYQPLADLVRFYSGGQVDFELQLVLKREETPACELGSESESGPRLGWVSWARTREPSRDPSETVLKL